MSRYPIWPLDNFESVKLSHSSQSNRKMCGNYFYTLWLIGEISQGFPDSIRVVGRKSSLPARKWEILMKEVTFSSGLFLKIRNKINFRSFFSQLTAKLRNMREWILRSIVESWNMLQFSFVAHDFLCLYTHSLQCKQLLFPF